MVLRVAVFTEPTAATSSSYRPGESFIYCLAPHSFNHSQHLWIERPHASDVHPKQPFFGIRLQLKPQLMPFLLQCRRMHFSLPLVRLHLSKCRSIDGESTSDVADQAGLGNLPS